MIYLTSYRPYDHLDEDELRRKLAEHKEKACAPELNPASRSIVSQVLAEFQHRGLKT